MSRSTNYSVLPLVTGQVVVWWDLLETKMRRFPIRFWWVGDRKFLLQHLNIVLHTGPSFIQIDFTIQTQIYGQIGFVRHSIR